MRPLKDLTGQQFGEWTVLFRVHHDRKHTMWKCKCSCGLTKDVYSTHLIQGNTHKCTKCTGLGKRGKNHGQYTGYGDICGDYWGSIRRGANAQKGYRKQIDFSITIEYAWNLFLKQNRRCALSNIPIFIDFKKYEHEHTASLDRIDNTKGYIEGNVQWVHKEVNMMKRTLDQDYFIYFCKKIAEYKETNFNYIK